MIKVKDSKDQSGLPVNLPLKRGFREKGGHFQNGKFSESETTALIKAVNEYSEEEGLEEEGGVRGPGGVINEIPVKTPALQLQHFVEGLNCFGKKWWFCAGFGVFTCSAEFILYALHENVTQDYERRTEEEEGAWVFVRVLYIIGFTLAALGFLVCFLTLARDEESREMPTCNFDFTCIN